MHSGDQVINRENRAAESCTCLTPSAPCVCGGLAMRLSAIARKTTACVLPTLCLYARRGERTQGQGSGARPHPARTAATPPLSAALLLQASPRRCSCLGVHLWASDMPLATELTHGPNPGTVLAFCRRAHKTSCSTTSPKRPSSDADVHDRTPPVLAVRTGKRVCCLKQARCEQCVSWKRESSHDMNMPAGGSGLVSAPAAAAETA